jgi:hypothetical protein
VIDPNELEAYDEWRAKRLVGSVDLSIETYNDEVNKLALAWDAGALYSINPSDREKITSTLAANPYRNGAAVSETTRKLTT